MVAHPLPDARRVHAAAQQQGRRTDRTGTHHHPIRVDGTTVLHLDPGDPPAVEPQTTYLRVAPHLEVGSAEMWTQEQVGRRTPHAAFAHQGHRSGPAVGCEQGGRDRTVDGRLLEGQPRRRQLGCGDHRTVDQRRTTQSVAPPVTGRRRPGTARDGLGDDPCGVVQGGPTVDVGRQGVVVGAGLEQQHVLRRILTEAAGDDAAGGPAPDDQPALHPVTPPSHRRSCAARHPAGRRGGRRRCTAPAASDPGGRAPTRSARCCSCGSRSRRCAALAARTARCRR